MLVAFPLLLVAFAVYNIIAFFWQLPFNQVVWSAPLRSGAQVDFSVADIVVGFALLCLLCEILKAARAATKSIVEHLLSVLLLIGAAAEFWLVKEAATATFAILLAITVIDVIGGFAVGRRPRQVIMAEPEVRYVEVPAEPRVNPPPVHTEAPPLVEPPPPTPLHAAPVIPPPTHLTDDAAADARQEIPPVHPPQR